MYMDFTEEFHEDTFSGRTVRLFWGHHLFMEMVFIKIITLSDPQTSCDIFSLSLRKIDSSLHGYFREIM